MLNYSKVRGILVLTSIMGEDEENTCASLIPGSSYSYDLNFNGRIK